MKSMSIFVVGFVAVMLVLVAYTYAMPDVKLTLEGNNLTIDGGDKAWIGGESVEYTDSFCKTLPDGEYSITVFENNEVIFGTVITVPGNLEVSQ